MGKISEITAKVKTAAKDLTTLEVATFTGPVPADLHGGGDVDGNTSEPIFSKIRAQISAGNLVGYTRFELDGDAINYVNSDLRQDQIFLLEAHKSLIAGAQESRKGLFDFVVSVLRGKDDD